MTISVSAAKKDYALDKSDLDGLPRPLTVDTVRAAALNKYGSEMAYKNAAQVLTLTRMPAVDLCIPRLAAFSLAQQAPPAPATCLTDFLLCCLFCIFLR